MQAVCEDQVWFSLAIAKHNVDFCNSIGNEEDKQGCVTELKKLPTRNPDSDNDGLTEEEERLYLTDPVKTDTDGDGLSDGEEVKKYHSDPNNKDSDGDGFTDGEEVKNGFDPAGSGVLKNR